MGMIDDLARSEIKALQRQVKRLHTMANVGYTSITEGGLRIASEEGLTVEGSAVVSGALSVSGSETVSGTLTITGAEVVDGTLTVAGHLVVSGDQKVTGPLDVTGDLTIGGDSTLTGNLVVNGGGTVKIDGDLPVTLGITSDGHPGLDWGAAGLIGADTGSLAMKSGAAWIQAVSGTGVALTMAPSAIYLYTTGTQIIGNLDITGTMTAATKHFKIPHPTKPDRWLIHGDTESDRSGIEYWDTATLGKGGTKSVRLPAYFEALAKPDGRSVIVTPVGKPFQVGADEIADGRFTVYGDPGRKVSWLVKAERTGADFDTEPKTDAKPVDAAS